MGKRLDSVSNILKSRFNINIFSNPKEAPKRYYMQFAEFELHLDNITYDILLETKRFKFYSDKLFIKYDKKLQILVELDVKEESLSYSTNYLIVGTWNDVGPFEDAKFKVFIFKTELDDRNFDYEEDARQIVDEIESKILRR